MGDLVQKDNAQCSHTKMVMGGHNRPTLFDSCSKTRPVNLHDSVEVDRAMLTLSKPLQAEPCTVSITSYTQDRSPISQDLPDR